jgi:chemotaxis signal transduction protein
VDVIILEIGSRRCAVELAAVEEVIALGPITPVPSAPEAVVGATNVRGQVCPVLQLERLAGLEDPGGPRASQPLRGHAGLLVTADGYRAVLYAHRIREVVRLQRVVRDAGDAGSPGADGAYAELETELGQVSLLNLEAILNGCAEQLGTAAGALS